MSKTVSHSIMDYMKEQHAEMVGFLKKMVRMESPTAVPEAQRELFRFLEDTLKELGFWRLKMPGRLSGGYLLARPAQREKFQPIQLLIGHCDTVWPLNTLENMPLVQENGQIKGPGVYDMKAGLAQIVFALKAIRSLGLELPCTPVVLINSDEEKGSRESTPAIRRLARIAKRAYVMEPPLGLDGRLKTARKGLGRFTITVEGEPAHAGLDPGKGSSAILELSHQIQQLFALNDLDKGITVNVGTIEGGTSANVVAPIGKAVVDVRVLTEEDGQRISEKIRDLKPIDPGTKVKIEGAIGRPPMERTPRNHALWLSAQKAGEQLGLKLEEATAGGGSDGNTTSQYTATLDGLGTTGDGAHAHHEFIYSEKLAERAALLALLLLME